MKYEVYKVESLTSKKGNAYKKLVLQEGGSQYPIKNVTMFASHPLFEEIASGTTVDLEIETKDSETPNPHGGFYKNRTVLNPNQPATPKTDSFAGSNAQVINILNFKVIPMLTEIHTLLQVAAKLEPEDDFKMPDFGENESEE